MFGGLSISYPMHSLRALDFVLLCSLLFTQILLDLCIALLFRSTYFPALLLSEENLGVGECLLLGL